MPVVTAALDTGIHPFGGKQPQHPPLEYTEKPHYSHAGHPFGVAFPSDASSVTASDSEASVDHIDNSRDSHFASLKEFGHRVRRSFSGGRDLMPAQDKPPSDSSAHVSFAPPPAIPSSTGQTSRSNPPSLPTTETSEPPQPHPSHDDHVSLATSQPTRPNHPSRFVVEDHANAHAHADEKEPSTSTTGAEERSPVPSRSYLHPRPPTPPPSLATPQEKCLIKGRFSVTESVPGGSGLGIGRLGTPADSISKAPTEATDHSETRSTSPHPTFEHHHKPSRFFVEKDGAGNIPPNPEHSAVMLKSMVNGIVDESHCEGLPGQLGVECRRRGRFEVFGEQGKHWDVSPTASPRSHMEPMEVPHKPEIDVMPQLELLYHQTMQQRQLLEELMGRHEPRKVDVMSSMNLLRTQTMLALKENEALRRENIALRRELEALRREE